MHLKNNGGVYTNAILICCRENFNEQKFGNVPLPSKIHPNTNVSSSIQEANYDPEYYKSADSFYNIKFGVSAGELFDLKFQITARLVNTLINAEKNG